VKAEPHKRSVPKQPRRYSGVLSFVLIRHWTLCRAGKTTSPGVNRASSRARASWRSAHSRTGVITYFSAEIKKAFVTCGDRGVYCVLEPDCPNSV
jgi:hypothetical protein